MLGKHPEDPFRPTTYKNNNLTWNGKRLTSYGTNTYKYNSEGIRISKTTSEGEYKYLLDGNKIIKEIKPNNKEIYYHYDEKEELVGFNYNTKEYFYIRDITGNITNIIDSIGTIKVSYEYDAWGKVINIDGDEELIEINSYLYKGYYYDKETSLYYCNSRYYDPEIRRWISIDDINYLDSETINGVNLYAYCMNNPVMCSDSSGQLPKWLTGMKRIITGIGAIVAGALVIASGVALVPMLIVAGVTIAAGVLTTVNGVADIQQSITGDNFIRDNIFNGDQSSYNFYAGITEGIATIGSIICGGWYKANQPRIQAYKNVDNYNFSGTLSDSSHLARPYQHSTLLQKNIIKYGKMVKEPSGIYNFTIGGSYKIGWVSYGVGNVGSHPVTWKLVLDIGKQIIEHAGF